MVNGHSALREFGKFRLDLEKKILWLGRDPIGLPLKAVELLCVLVERHGQVVSKDEIWHEVWNDAFLEETNVTHNIYLLRKTFKDHGEPELIKTIPRRGYRFTGEVRQLPDGEIVIERHGLTRTLIEIDHEDDNGGARLPKSLLAFATNRPFVTVLTLGLVLLLFGGGFLLWDRSARVGSEQRIRSIAVLPLKSFDRNDDDSLRLRITDALITRLGGMKAVAVRPTSAVIPFANDDGDPVAIAAKLKTDAVLDGRIQQEGDRVRVTLQLISVRDGRQLWSEQFDGLANHLLELQDDISNKVSGSLDQPESQQLLAKAPTDIPEAYEAYLKGRYFWAKRDEASLRKALDFFREAVALDPKFSEAYSGIADTQLVLYDQNIEVNSEIISQAKETLHQALLIKPDSAAALSTLGSIQMTYDWDWKDAEESLRLATESDPNSPVIWTRYGGLLMKVGRFDESIAAIQRAVELDPLSLIANVNLGMAYFCKKDFAAADLQFNRTLEINDQFGVTHWMLSRSLWQEARKPEAVNEIIRGLELDGNDDLANRLKETARTSQPEAVINALLYEWRNNPEKTNPHNMAYLSTYVGDKEKAIYWLQRSLNEHHPWTVWVKAAPEFDPLRSDPRFQAIVRQTNLGE
jgi:DNA-binding winged helix-turn-helix (wHTH) protein/TolB-like protein/cytochrome c-type biogenesis protein CcmH/NrfG